MDYCLYFDYTNPIPMGHQITREEFEALPEYEQKHLLVDSNKVAEHYDDVAKYEFFQVANFFVEVKVSFVKRYRVITHTYNYDNIPLEYAHKVQERLGKWYR